MSASDVYVAELRMRGITSSRPIWQPLASSIGTRGEAMASKREWIARNPNAVLRVRKVRPRERS